MTRNYGVAAGQRYIPADGSAGYLDVIDDETFMGCGDVVVRDQDGNEKRIDVFKLAMVRYTIKLNSLTEATGP